jgi:Family of unknown function (DUF6152)
MLKHAIPAGLAILALVASAGQASAHHAFAAEFDGSAPVLLRGKVTRVEWINPHAWVHLVAVTPGKPDQAWMVEGGTPNTLLRAGVTRATLKPGTTIIVRGYQSKDHLCTPECRANGRDVTLENGEKVFMGSSGTGAPKDGADPNEK